MPRLTRSSGVALRAVDTNVLVRLIVDDDPLQSAAAEKAMTSEPVFISKTVILEFQWVLRSVYRLSPEAIASAIESLLVAEDISIEDASAVRQAIHWFKNGMDPADALHLASSAHADAFLTFDTSLRRRAATFGARPPAIAP
jgi:predicted nucleic-acid-binding protein